VQEQSRHNRIWTRRAESAPHRGGEVGRIALGERLFIVVAASDLSDWPQHKENCRFELDGFRLVVLETKDQHRPDTPAAVAEVAARLTGRELEIAILVAQGHATKRIAYRLQISEWTVATYLRRIFAKLNVDNRAAMVFRCAPLINASLVPAMQGRRAELTSALPEK
jgi:DNA-binding CsgD family transcriptional regulator